MASRYWSPRLELSLNHDYNFWKISFIFGNEIESHNRNNELEKEEKASSYFEYIENMYAYSSMIIHHTFTSNLSMLSSHEMRCSGFSPTGIHVSTCQYLWCVMFNTSNMVWNYAHAVHKAFHCNHNIIFLLPFRLW